MIIGYVVGDSAHSCMLMDCRMNCDKLAWGVFLTLHSVFDEHAQFVLKAVPMFGNISGNIQRTCKLKSSEFAAPPIPKRHW